MEITKSEMIKCILHETGQALFQLRFGPFEHCSQWHHDEVEHVITFFLSCVCSENVSKKLGHIFPPGK